MCVPNWSFPVSVQFGNMVRPAHDPSHLVADINAAREVLGWVPEMNLSYAVWELAREIAPDLVLRRPERGLGKVASIGDSQGA